MHFPTREEQASSMDFTEDNMTQGEMLEKIAELDYSQSHLRDLNAKMRHWLDVADDDMAAMRSENTALSQRVKTLEKIISDAQKAEADPCRSLLANDFDTKRCRETEMQALEEKYTTIKEQNKKLSAELQSLKLERDRDKINLSKFKDQFQHLQFRLEEAQLCLQRKDEVIHQKDLELQHDEEMVEEYRTIIKDLRLTNQELRMQLENRLDEASLTVLNDAVREKEGPLNPPLSFAEELMLLASSDAVESIILDPSDLKHDEDGTEELMKSQSLTVDLQTKRCAGTFEIALRIAVLFLLFVFILAVSGNLFSVNTICSDVFLMMQPYLSVQYEALPPI
ncbi:CDK5 regulatory subunit-associated protein 2-like isoform X1 [Xyrichtys novacula]|uniref:CDK5 regulatory subunit-associated protein 2-like isoform X1 n=1 Tax=Xyrichtys novacula TaxID=13765 RepID=A0AAV1FBE7_XYRNO|nr:CDK5 regulatory subunit-associated protein 2-like isoform X1 [Xyrichtys novacula]